MNNIFMFFTFVRMNIFDLIVISEYRFVKFNYQGISGISALLNIGGVESFHDLKV